MDGFKLEEYRQSWETGEHWELKLEFIEKYKDSFSVDRLLCLAQAYSNIELLHCSYPNQVMREIYELSKPLKACKVFRERVKSSSVSDEKTAVKRKIENDANEKPMKSIKFCSEQDSTECNESGDIEGKNSVSKSSFTEPLESEQVCSTDKQHAKDGVPERASKLEIDECLKKFHEMAEEIKNQMTLDISPMGAIHNAAQKTNLKVNFKLTKDTSSMFKCEFLLENITICTVSEKAKRKAKNKAAKDGVAILLDSTCLYSRLCKNNANSSEINASTYEASEDINKILYETVTISEVKNELIKNLGQECMQYFVKEIERTLSEMSSDLSYTSAVYTAASILKIDHAFDFIFSSKYSTHICKLIMDTTVVSVGKGFSIDKAKENSFKNAVSDVFNVKYWLDSPIETVEKKPFSEENISVEYILYAFNDTNDVEQNPSEITDDNLKLVHSLSEKVNEHVNLPPYEAIIAAGRNLEDKNLLSIQTFSKDNAFICKIILKNILVTQGTALSKVKAQQASAKAAVKLFSKAKKFILKKTKTLPQDMTSETFSRCINEDLLKTSYEKQFVLLEKSENQRHGEGVPGSILQHSSSFCHKNLSYEHSKSDNSLFKVDVLLDGDIIGSASSKEKKDAKRQAAFAAVENLRKIVYTIKIKDDNSGFEVPRQQFCDSEINSKAFAESNIGCKLLKGTGYSGNITSGTTMNPADFKRKIHTLLLEFKKSNSPNDLIFRSDFSKPERQEILSIAQKCYKLVGSSYGVGDARHLLIRNKFTAVELLDHLVKAEGSTLKYDLIDLSGE